MREWKKIIFLLKKYGPKIKKQAIADDIQDFWIVFKVQKDATNQKKT